MPTETAKEAIGAGPANGLTTGLASVGASFAHGDRPPVRAFITRAAERFSSFDPPASTARAHAFRQLALTAWKAENPSAVDVGEALRHDSETYTTSARESGLTVPQLLNTVVAVLLFALQAKNTELQVEIDTRQGQVETGARGLNRTRTRIKLVSSLRWKQCAKNMNIPL